MSQRESRNAVKVFSDMGIKVEQVTTVEALKTKSWIKPTSDRKGIVRLQTRRVTS